MNEDTFHKISKAIADPQRFEILERIASRRELACTSLVADLPITQATISHHLKELASAGLIESRKEGKCHYFKACRGELRAYRSELGKRLDRRVGGRKTESKNA